MQAANISINAAKSSIIAFSNSRVDIEGNYIEINSDSGTVIDTRGNSVVNINQNKQGVVILNGDVLFETPNTPENSQNSGNLINSYVNVNLTKGSFWTGRAYQYYEDGENVELNSEPYYGNVTGFSLAISDGAEWNMTGDSFVNTVNVENGGTINVANDVTTFNADSVTLNNADINVKGNATITINTLSGSGADIAMVAQTDGETVTTGKITVVNEVSDDTTLNVTATGITSDDITNADAALASMQANIAASGATITNNITQGDINGALSQTVAADGTASDVRQASNTKLDSLSSITAISVVQWRHEMNDLTKRMGELRDSPEGIGSWVRIYGSEQDYQGTKQKSTSVQVGADYALGDWVIGGAFSYTDGSTDYSNGSGDTKSYGIAAYGTWMTDNGMFVDLIGKYSRLENDFEIENMSGSLDNNALSVSAEFGWRFDLNDIAYVEPQAELTYGRIFGDDTTTSNAVKVDQDDTDALLGRIGVRAGLKFPDNRGSIYARVSGVYDFKGESKIAFSKGTTSKYEEDLGGAWVEYAVGANFNWTENTYSYVDLERTSGGEVKENWRWNVGIRHVF